ncbi:PAS domain S-box protein [Anoxybacterium hadale]|uniref:PAS domain S-box protein n=1 Tax=Anoxybacterium hadale TaxID=3408580 RepID=A0ACD1A6L2_9FIRM|nr:PAS domain S-box protein [Clostridiales bacterium]
MDQSVFIALVNNAALLLALAVVYELTYLFPAKSCRSRQLISGILISMICILIMKIPLELHPGLMIDTRSILISTSGLIFGPIPTVITVISAMAFRVYSGGIGALPGLGIILTSALIGSAWRLILYPRSKKWSWLNVYIMSLTVHSAMLICMFLLPYPESVSVLRDIGIPVLLIYPVVSILLCLLLLRQQEIREYQLQLRQSEERFQTLFDHAPLGYQSLDENGCFLNVNQQWLDTLGYTSEEVLGRWFGDFLMLESRKLFQRQFPVFKARGYARSELILIHKSGKPIHIAFEGRIGYDMDGALKQIHCVLQDITELKMKEEALTNSELKYHRLFESMKEGILMIEADSGIITEINPYLLQLSGYSEDFFVGKRIWNLGLFHEIAESSIEIITLKDGESLKFEDSGFFSIHGAYRNTEIAVSACHVKELKMLQMNVRDITERKRIENALLESEIKYSSYIQNALLESEIKYSSHIENAPGGITITPSAPFPCCI